MRNYTYTELPNEISEHLAVNAGIILNDFNPLNPASPTVIKSHIMFATSGGVNVSCVPTYSDWFEDVDNAPKNCKEGMHLDGWEAKFSGTGITYTPDNIRSALGAATVAAITEGVASGSTVNKIVPNDSIANSDFKDLWYVTDWNEGNGFIAIKLVDALSDGGFTHQSADNGKGQISFSYTGHKTASDLSRPPMEFYVVDTTEATGKYAVAQILGQHITSSYTDVEIDAGDDFEAEYTAAEGYSIDAVTVTVGGAIVSGAYSAGTVTLNDVDGDVVITVTEVAGA